MSFVQNPSLTIPQQNVLVDENGMVSRYWGKFFELIKKIIDPLGLEQVIQLENNISIAQNVTDLVFNVEGFSQGIVEYLIQRVTTGGGAVEQIQTGTLLVAYLPTSLSWSLTSIGTAWPVNAGITFSITPAGQVQYTSTNLTGTTQLSRMSYRLRTLSCKSNVYSKFGRQ